MANTHCGTTDDFKRGREIATLAINLWKYEFPNDCFSEGDREALTDYLEKLIGDALATERAKSSPQPA